MRVAVHDLQAMSDRGEKFAMVTAYDYTSGQLVDRAGLPIILVGDSLGTVIQGHDTTIPVTLDDIIYHARAVVRGARRALVVGDLPFMTYPSVAEGLRSAARLFQEGRVQAVKLEGGGERIPVVEAVVDHGVPVMGHLGYTPQSAHLFGRKVVRGKTAEQAEQILADAQRLQDAGAFAVVLECIPAPLAAMVTARLRIPTIGIGSGPDCDGQVQVWHDMLGLYTDFQPRHAKVYVNLAEQVTAALAAYQDDVRQAAFPDERHSSTMPDEALRALIKLVDEQRTA